MNYRNGQDGDGADETGKDQMEPVTHFLTGACLARSGLNRKTAYATLAMTLAAEAPDLDVLWGFRGPVVAFEHHRGITHTLPGAPFVALVVTGAVWLFDRYRKREPPIPPRWTVVWFFSLLAVLSHILLDWTNNYGIRPFYPFNSRWYSLDLVFIFEPVIFLGAGAGFGHSRHSALWRTARSARAKGFRGRGWAIARSLIAALSGCVRWRASARAPSGRAHALRHRAPAARCRIEPYPGNPFHWFAIVETADYFQTGSVDTSPERSTPTSRMSSSSLLSPARSGGQGPYLGRAYLDWAAFPVVTDRGSVNLTASADLAPNPLDTAVEFRDLRFAYSLLSRTGSAPLTAWVYVTPGGAVDAMVMDNHVQK